jgi:hypothetical protein
VNYGNISGGKMMFALIAQPVYRKRKKIRNRKIHLNSKFSDTDEIVIVPEFYVVLPINELKASLENINKYIKRTVV